MRANRYRALVIAALALLTAAGCGTKGSGPSSSKSARELIQESLTETITRWHYGDKGGLYDNEFQYVRDRINFDDYLKMGELRLDADTVEAMNVKDAKVYGNDSATVYVDVVFKGPTGKISHQADTYQMYYRYGKWIRPTVGVLAEQLQYESSRRAADSAADAEAKELEGK
jgi:hypothetical protein